MFGHQDDNSAHNDNPVSDEPDQKAPEPGAPVATPESSEADSQPAPDAAAPASDNNAGGDNADNADKSEELVIKPESDEPEDSLALPSPTDSQDNAPDTEESGNELQHPAAPLDTNEDNEPISDVISPAGGFPKRPTFQYPAGLTSDAGPAPADGDNPQDEELLTIKKQALGELSPLIDKLDLAPEERFRTLMMIIQADDDESLVKRAYEAAHSIEDEKVRGQALLDIVNEVNYFTQPPSDQPSED